MTFDHELKFINEDNTEVAILCGLRSVTRSEHYAAAAHGMQPDIIFIVNKHDYEGQEEVEFENVRYRVYRSYLAEKPKNHGDFESLELICKGW